MLSLKLSFCGDWRGDGPPLLLFPSIASETEKLRDQRQAGSEMARESAPLNNNRNGTKEFDRADRGKQMKATRAVN